MLTFPASLAGDYPAGNARALIPDLSGTRTSVTHSFFICPLGSKLSKTDKFVNCFETRLTSRGYAATTVRSYTRCAATFVREFLSPEQIESLDEDVIRQTIIRLCATSRVRAADAVVAQAIVAFYREVFGRCLRTIASRSEHKSTLFSAQDVRKFFAAIKDPKHRAAVLLIYILDASIAEAVNIYLSDVVVHDNAVAVRIRAEGTAWRLVGNAEVGSLLQTYVRRYYPARFLFEGREGGPYSERRLQQILCAASVRAGLRKSAGQKALRIAFQQHIASYGTHLLLLEDALRR